MLVELLVKYKDSFWKLAKKLKMLSSKRSNFDCEIKLFSNEWFKKYFAIQHNENVICLIYQNTIAVVKEQWWAYKSGAGARKTGGNF